MIRTLPQNALFHALVLDVWRALPRVPWRRPVALEAWKRWFLAKYVREARLEAWVMGRHDPFPARVARSSELESWQMNELIECTYALCAQQLGLVLDRDDLVPLHSEP
jgi:ribosomal protein S18 acetylase RimI-like enzyme